MKKCFALHWERMLHGRKFKIALCIGIAIAVLQWLDSTYLLTDPGRIGAYLFPVDDLVGVSEISMEAPNTVYEEWIGVDKFSFFAVVFYMAMPLLAVLPYGTELLEDHLSGYNRHVVIRKNREAYYLTGFMTAFLSGMLVIAIPMVINFLLHTSTYPLLIPQDGRGSAPIGRVTMWGALFFEHPLVYTLIYLFIPSFYCGLVACFSVAIGLVFEQRFVSLFFPFVLFMFANTASIAMGEDQCSPYTFLCGALFSSKVTPFVFLVTGLILFLPALFTYLYKRKGDVF